MFGHFSILYVKRLNILGEILGERQLPAFSQLLFLQKSSITEVGQSTKVSALNFLLTISNVH